MKTVCVLGGSGFVGSELCTQLYKKGYLIRLLTRNSANCRHLRVLPSLTVVEIEKYTSDSIAAHLGGSDVLINLIGILNEKENNGSGFHHAHVEITRAALIACERSIVRRYLQMSALNADPNGPSHYLRSKGKAEYYLKAFANPLVHATIFRPSVIFGKNDSFLNRFAGLLKWTPVLFPLACPNSRFSPVYVGDVARRMVDAIDDESTYDKSIDLCGPNEYSLKELVQYTATQCGYRRIIIGLPNFLSRLQARVLQLMPGKPFSMDNYHSLQQDSVCKDGTKCATSLEAIAPLYLYKPTHTNPRHPGSTQQSVYN